MTARRITAAAVLALAFGMLVAGAVVAARNHLFASFFPPDVGAGIACAAVGAFLLVRSQGLVLAVILCVQGVTSSATALTGAVRDVAAQSGPLHGATLWVAWVSDWVWLPGVALLVPLVLLFPDGRLVSPRWVWLIRLQAVLVTVMLGLGLLQHASLVDGTDYRFAPNPTGVLTALSSSTLDRISEPTFLGFFIVLAVSLGSVLVRRRRAVGVERAQLTCLVYGTSVTVVLILIGTALGTLPDTWWVWLISLVSVAPIPVAVAVAVLRYRLYEIDRVVSRTVTYALVLAVLIGVYVGMLSGLAALIPTDYGQVGVAAATLAVAALAVPLTRRVRHVVDRRFHRGRFDAERVVAAFAARLRAQPDRGDVGADLVAVLQRTVQPSHAAVWTVPR